MDLQKATMDPQKANYGSWKSLSWWVCRMLGREEESTSVFMWRDILASP
jgi:hypothetical protein